MRELTEVFDTVPELALLANDERAALVAHLDCREEPTGTVLLTEEDDADDRLFLLLRGQVDVVATRPDGGFGAAYRLEGPSVLGELGFVDRAPRSATCTAASPVLIGILTRAQLDTLEAEHVRAREAIEHFLARVMVQRLRGLQGVLEEALRGE